MNGKLHEHCVAWSESIDSATLTPINGVRGGADLRDSANNPFFRQDWKLWGLYVQSPTLTRAQISQPSWPAIRTVEVYPATIGAAPPTDPNLMDLRDMPVYIKALDALELQASEGAVGAEQVTGVAFLHDGMGRVRMPISDDLGLGRYIIRGTSTTAAVAFEWSNLDPITWNQNWPRGHYQITGFTVQGAGAIAGRLILPGDQNYRPGCLAITAFGNRTHPAFLGEPRDCGSFDSYALPSIEVLANAATASWTVMLEVIRISDAYGLRLQGA